VILKETLAAQEVIGIEFIKGKTVNNLVKLIAPSNAKITNK